MNELNLEALSVFIHDMIFLVSSLYPNLQRWHPEVHFLISLNLNKTAQYKTYHH